MAAMTICAWVLATPKQRARCRTKRRFIVPRHCSTRNRRLEICLLKRFSDWRKGSPHATHHYDTYLLTVVMQDQNCGTR